MFLLYIKNFLRLKLNFSWDFALESNFLNGNFIWHMSRKRWIDPNERFSKATIPFHTREKKTPFCKNIFFLQRCSFFLRKLFNQKAWQRCYTKRLIIFWQNERLLCLICSLYCCTKCNVYIPILTWPVSPPKKNI